MAFNLFKQILWKEGVYIAIAVVGGLSSIVSIFIDINAMISIKWLLFCIWLSLTVGIIFVKIIFVIATFKRYSSEETKVIKYIDNKQILIIKTDMALSFNSTLSIYKNQGGYEDFIAIGYVKNVQENGMIQIQITKFIKEDEKLLPKTLKTLIFKTALPYDYVIIDINNKEIG